jgi:hypothetical protein
MLVFSGSHAVDGNRKPFLTLVKKQRLTIQTELDVWRSDLLQTGLLDNQKVVSMDTK